MCGRYALRASAQDVISAFGALRGLDLLGDLLGRDEIFPTTSVLAIRSVADAPGEREAVGLRWGLVPPFPDPKTAGAKMINARSETAAVKNSFRGPMRRRRCLVPATDYFEWKAVPGEKKKQRHSFALRDGSLLAFAAIWDVWRDHGTGEELQSVALLTCEPRADGAIRAIHDRMPVLLQDAQAQSIWLGPEQNVAQLQHLLVPVEDEALVIEPA